MESELRYISCISIIVGPPDIRRIRDIRIGTSHRLLVFIGSIVGYLIILQSLFFIIFATGQLVPFIIGNAIPVRIDRDHHYPGFATTSQRGIGTRIVIGIKCVTQYFEIVFSRPIDNRMVETDDNISAVASQRDHRTGVVCQTIFDFLPHRFFGISLGISRKLIDKLSRCRAIFINLSYVRAISYLFFANDNTHKMGYGISRIINLESQPICSRFTCYKRIIACRRHNRIGDRYRIGLVRKSPFVSFSGKSRV